jgi:hypothetical protein
MYEGNPGLVGGSGAEPADFLVYLLETVACFYFAQGAEMPGKF